MGTQPVKIDLPPAEIARICQTYRIREMGLFGSVARGQASLNSDMDIFVEFEPGFHPGYACSTSRRIWSACWAAASI